MMSPSILPEAQLPEVSMVEEEAATGVIFSPEWVFPLGLGWITTDPRLWIQRREWALRTLRKEGVRSVSPDPPPGVSAIDNRFLTWAAVRAHSSSSSSSPLPLFPKLRSDPSPRLPHKKQRKSKRTSSSSKCVPSFPFQPPATILTPAPGGYRPMAQCHPLRSGYPLSTITVRIPLPAAYTLANPQDGDVDGRYREIQPVARGLRGYSLHGGDRASRPKHSQSVRRSHHGHIPPSAPARHDTSECPPINPFIHHAISHHAILLPCFRTTRSSQNFDFNAKFPNAADHSNPRKGFVDPTGRTERVFRYAPTCLATCLAR